MRCLIALALVACAACVGAPVRQEPDVGIATPARWSAAQPDPGPTREDWWSEFDDPHLTTLVEIALERNQDLHVAAARLARALAEARIAGADLKPTAGVGFGASRQRQVFIGFPFGSDSSVPHATFTTYGVSVDTAWEIDLWGRIRAGARAAVAEAQATEAELHGAQLSIAAQTARAWFATQEALQQVAMARDSAENFERLAEQIRARYEQGLRSPLDLRLALSNAAAARASLERRRARLDSSERQVELLLGGYPSADLLESYRVEAPPPMPPPVPAGLPAELVARRPDLVAAERRLAAADQRVLAARRSLYPRLSLTASGGSASDALVDLLDGDFGVWSLVANLTQPLFQGGRLRAGVERADAAADESLARYAGDVLQAYSEVETALAGEQYLAEEERHAEMNVRHLLAAERLAEERYSLGVGDYLAVLESQTRSFLARSDLIGLRRQRLTNRVDLHLALGGGFAAPPDWEQPEEEEAR